MQRNNIKCKYLWHSWKATQKLSANYGIIVIGFHNGHGLVKITLTGYCPLGVRLEVGGVGGAVYTF